MSELSVKPAEGSEGAPRLDMSDNPLLFQLVFVKMEDVMDKLKLLDYESKFCKKLKFKPFARHYFALATNPGEQFFAFSNVAVWLLNLIGPKSKLEQPQESDDPNATIATILSEAKKQGVQANFPPAKLKSGAGEQVCRLLDGLAEKALSSVHFKWNKPAYPIEREVSSEMMAERMSEESVQPAEEVAESHDDSDDEGPVFLDFTGLSIGKETEENKIGLDSVLESSVDAQEWRLEVERVLPSLKIQIKQDDRDWRAHYQQMHSHSNGIASALDNTRSHLDKLHKEITKALEKIESREKYTNSQLQSLIQEFRKSQDQLAEVKENYSQSSGGVTNLSRELAQITEELETVKAEMDQRGSSMTDAAPLVRIKQALTRIKNDNIQTEIRLNVVEHTLLEAELKTKSAIKMKMNIPMSLDH